MIAGPITEALRQLRALGIAVAVCAVIALGILLWGWLGDGPRAWWALLPVAVAAGIVTFGTQERRR